jgi:hypothetical protein
MRKKENQLWVEVLERPLGNSSINGFPCDGRTCINDFFSIKSFQHAMLSIFCPFSVKAKTKFQKFLTFIKLSIFTFLNVFKQYKNGSINNFENNLYLNLYLNISE